MKLFQPFKYIAGWQALGWGLLGIVVSTIINIFSNNHFDGIVDAHAGLATPIGIYVLEPLVYGPLPILTFYIAGKLLADRPFRFIDIAGTLLFARLPMVVISLLAFLVKPGPVDINNIPPMAIVSGIVGLLFIIWFIALMYQGFTVSCNLKGAKAIIGFIVTLLATEITGHFTIHYIYRTIL